MAVCGALLALALLGLMRPGPRPLRLLALLLALAFAVVAAGDARAEWQSVDGEAATAVDDRDRTALLAAAAAAGPRAADLQIGWRSAPSAPGAPSAAAPAAVFGAVGVLPAPLPLQPESLQVRALSAATAGRPLLLRVEPIVAEPELGLAVPALLRVEREGAEVFAAAVTLSPQRPAMPSFVPTAAGEHELLLQVRIGTTVVNARGSLDVAEPAAVLVIEPSGLAAAALRAQGLRVDTAAGPPADWRRYGACVLGQSLPPAAQQDLVAAALDGLGLFVLPAGFGAEDSPIRALLPLRPRPKSAAGDGAGGRAPAPPSPEPPPATTPPPQLPPPEPAPGPVPPEPIEVDKRAIAMVLVVDRSGSMGTVLANGLTKMSYAKSSALQTARALSVGDEVGLVTFGNKDAGRVELPLVDATDLPRVRAGIEALGHRSELTYLLSGLRQARQLLRPSAAAVKHIVVVSDGEFFQSEELALRAEANAMRGDRISLSVISIIDRQTDPGFMTMAENLTQDGAGQFLPTDDPTTVPAFMVAEVTRALQRVGRKPQSGNGATPTPTPGPPSPSTPEQKPPPEPPPATKPLPAPVPSRLAVRAVAPSPLLLPRPEGDWPTLADAVAGEAPLDAQVLLVAGEEGWPLLAFGNRGLGRVAGFAADLFGPAGAEFRGTAAFPAHFAQWLQSLLPPLPPASTQPLLTRRELVPPVPTPADRDRLAALAGQPPVAVAEPPPPAWRRQLRDVVPAWAGWLLAAVLLFACAERLWIARHLRGGA